MVADVVEKIKWKRKKKTMEVGGAFKREEEAGWEPPYKLYLVCVRATQINIYLRTFRLQRWCTFTD
ncbi:hypothetical protein COK55_06935 [Bacillus cereus]|nr:hypothetical protein COK55_06935 [Bacillus cereus]